MNIMLFYYKLRNWIKGKKWREKQAEINRRNNEWQNTKGHW
jgi:hypothetical protein